MNRLDLTQTGGFPLETDKLDFMQDSYTLLQNLATSIGAAFPCIVSGCVVTGGDVSAGIMIIEGEVVNFLGGPLDTNVKIIETVTNETYEDGNSKPVYVIRAAQFSLTGTIPFASFIRIESLVQTNSKLKFSIKQLAQAMSLQNGRIVLHGCKITKVSNDYTHTYGAINYFGTVYTTDALVTPLTDASTPKWKIDTTSLLENKMKLCLNSDPAGLFLYTAVQDYIEERIISGPSIPNDFVAALSVSAGSIGIYGSSGTGEFGIKLIKHGRTCTVSGMVYIDIPDSTQNNLFLSGSSFPIGTAVITLSGGYKGIGYNYGGFSKSNGIAMCWNIGASGSSLNTFGSAAPAAIRINGSGDIEINAIPPPGANKRIAVQFSITYLLP